MFETSRILDSYGLLMSRARLGIAQIAEGVGNITHADWFKDGPNLDSIDHINKGIAFMEECKNLIRRRMEGAAFRLRSPNFKD